MDGKPIIRHCKNCKYYKPRYGFFTGAGDCDVKYDYLPESSQRITAIFCKYYKQKESEENG